MKLIEKIGYESPHRFALVLAGADAEAKLHVVMIDAFFHCIDSYIRHITLIILSVFNSLSIDFQDVKCIFKKWKNPARIFQGEFRIMESVFNAALSSVGHGGWLESSRFLLLTGGHGKDKNSHVERVGR